LDAPHFAVDDGNFILKYDFTNSVPTSLLLGFGAAAATSERCLPVGIIGQPCNPV